jgi:hypothetical protein
MKIHHGDTERTEGFFVGVSINKKLLSLRVSVVKILSKE